MLLAISLFDSPAAAASTIRLRVIVRYGVVDAFTHFLSNAFCVLLMCSLPAGFTSCAGYFKSVKM